MSEPITPPEGAPPSEPQTAAQSSEPDWKAEARKWETRAKENASKLKEATPKLAEYDRYVQSSKTELQRAQEQAQQAQQQASELQRQVQRTAAARAAGLDVDLEEFLTGTTPEELADQAKRLAARFTATAGTTSPRVPVPNHAQGRSATPAPTDGAGYMNALIRGSRST